MLTIAILLCVLIGVAKVTGFTVHPILSGSMEPAIMTGSLVLVKDVPIETLQKGDVIAFRPADRSIGIAHRIIDLKDDGKQYSITTKGDNNSAKDSQPYVANKGSDIGKLYFSMPFLGYVMTFLKTKSGILFLSALFALAFAATFWPRSEKVTFEKPSTSTSNATE